MIKNVLYFAAVLALGAQAQVNTSQDMGHGVGVLDSGVTLHYKTVLEPVVRNSTFMPLGGGFGVSGDTMHHAIYDRGAKSYFGYDLTVTPGDGPNTRTVVVGPLSLARMREALAAVAGDLPLNPAPLPKYPAPQTVYSGDTIAMDLMVSPDGRERIVDYVEFTFGQKASRPAKAETAAPRDFTIDDGAPHMDPEQAEVWIDGRKFDGNVVTYAPHGGATLWIYVPGRGRFLLSLAPRDGFARTGVVRGRNISFSADAGQVEIRMSAPVAGTEKAWNLYTVRDTTYVPRPALINAVVMGTDRLENLLAK
jgi:hypothetical protein